MSEFGKLISGYMTPEVATVLAVVAAGWVGLKVGAKTLGFVGSIFKKASFMGASATVLALIGLASAGIGFGELRTRTTPESETPIKAELLGMSPDKLASIGSDTDITPDKLKMILEYVTARDGHRNAASDEMLSQLALKANKENHDVVMAVIEMIKAREQHNQFEVNAIVDSRNEKRSEKRNAAKFASATNVSYEDDVFATKPASEVNINPESMVSVPVAWAMTLAGLGSLGAAGFIYGNRGNNRSASDPHHPNQLKTPVA